MKSDKKNSRVLHISTPFLVLLLCAGITLPLSLKIYDKLKVYLNVAFMDDLKTTPDENGGLIIKENSEINEKTGVSSEEGEVIRPSFGEQFAVMKCGKFDLDIPVYWGSRKELFERGACQSSGSMLPGIDGNVVISAHIDTFFAELPKLEEGDEITLITKYGKFTYTVKEKIEFESTDDKYLNVTEDSRLTLYTCKKDIFSISDMRIGVICELKEKAYYITKEGE